MSALCCFSDARPALSFRPRAPLSTHLDITVECNFEISYLLSRQFAVGIGDSAFQNCLLSPQLHHFVCNVDTVATIRRSAGDGWRRGVRSWCGYSDER